MRADSDGTIDSLGVVKTLTLLGLSMIENKCAREPRLAQSYLMTAEPALVTKYPYTGAAHVTAARPAAVAACRGFTTNVNGRRISAFGY